MKRGEWRCRDPQTAEALAQAKVVLAAICSDGVALDNVETALRQSVPQQLRSS
jgi:hypothetical protein